MRSVITPFGVVTIATPLDARLVAPLGDRAVDQRLHRHLADDLGERQRCDNLGATRRIGDGTVVEGSDRARTEATEVWTFLRSRGGTWILSAIQQVRPLPRRPARHAARRRTRRLAPR